MLLFWLGLGLMCSMSATVAVTLAIRAVQIGKRHLPTLERIFQERPLFVLPRGEPWVGPEQVRFPTSDGLTLFGCYLRTATPRRGVILFGLEFGSACWSCWPYVQHLVEHGFDVFAYEPRNQGSSDVLPGYDPLHWVTDYEVRDAEAALAYLKGRSDADPRGVGLFGISKGGGAGLVAAARDAYVRCCATDGAYATFSTMVPYMRHWFRIYNRQHVLQGLLPSWFYGIFARIAMYRVGRSRQCHFANLEPAVRRLAPRPLLMIHGEADNYIKPAMALAVFEHARGPKELWFVEGAKHNQALQLVGDEYRRRVLHFFEQHLAGDRPAPPAIPGPVLSLRETGEPVRA